MHLPSRSTTVGLTAMALMLTSCSTPDPRSSEAPAQSGTASPPETSGAGTAAPSGSPSSESSASASETTETPTTTPGSPQLEEMAVAAAHPEAVDAGMEILQDGGSAVDAAVAAAFAVAVVEPYASGIGGGGSTILAGHGDDPVSYDYREVVAEDGEIPESGTGVPGFVAGLARIHDEHGDMAWQDLLDPAVELADEGFPVSDFLALRLRSDAGPASIEGLDHFHGSSGDPLAAGDRLVQEDLAETMRTLAQDGPESFYSGGLAEELTAVDGLDAETLTAYAPTRTDPVGGPVGEHTLLSAAPPLPGAALIQQMQIAESLGIADHAPDSAGHVDRLTRAWTTADESVDQLFGDPDVVDVPTDRLTDPERNAALAEEMDPAGMMSSSTQTDPSSAVTAGNTTHLTVVDGDGATVSMTNTLTSFWGGGESEYVDGYFLNNQLSRFATQDSDANQPAAGRQSVSWSAPSMVLDDDGRPVLGLGSPGGHQIPNILTSVLASWGLRGTSLQEAVDAPRHHLEEGVLAVEEEPSDAVETLISERNWDLWVTEREEAIFGSVQALEIDHETGRISGAEDSRREGGFAVADVGSATGTG